MLFSNEFILDDKKNAKKYLRLRLGAPYRACPKTVQCENYYVFKR